MYIVLCVHFTKKKQQHKNKELSESLSLLGIRKVATKLMDCKYFGL